MKQRQLKDMTLREKIGQLVVTGFQGEQITEEYAALVKEYKIANTIFFSYNCTSEDQIKKLCESVQKLVEDAVGTSAFITIDQEGGCVVRLPENSLNFPGAMAMARSDESDAYQAAFYTGQKLRNLGINFNLAPVLDINSNPDNPVIGVRSFGNDAATAAKYGCAMVRGYLDAGVLCSVKHFPGHGDTSVDSHLSLPSVEKSYEELKEMELIPFERAIHAETAAVTLAHILFPKIEKEKIPATMSSQIIRNILQKDLGFQGLVISDCMEMNAIQEYFGTAAGAVRAIKAGVDLVFISHTAKIAAQAVCLLEEAVANGEIPLERIDEAAGKVLDWKQKVNRMPVIEISKSEDIRRNAFCQKIMEKAVHFTNREEGHQFNLGDSPVFLGCFAYRSTLASSNVDNSLHFASYFGKLYQADSFSFPVQPEEEQINHLFIQLQEKKYTSVVIATYNAHLNTGQLKLAEKLEALKIPLAVVALRNPYDLEKIDDRADKIAAYEYSENSFQAIEKLFTGAPNN